MSKTYSKTRTLVECALMIALGTVLANIKIYSLPNGGSITLFSMLPFIMISFRHGVKWGLFTGFVNSLLQMLLGFYAPPAPGLLPLVGMILLDYVLAFTLPRAELVPLLANGWPIHVIGRVEAGQGVTLLDATGQDITPVVRGYQHFHEAP